LTCLSAIFSISFHISTYFSSIFSISFDYSTYFSSIYFILWKGMKNMEETQVE
jgi:hypothetical protein